MLWHWSDEWSCISVRRRTSQVRKVSSQMGISKFILLDSSFRHSPSLIKASTNVRTPSPNGFWACLSLPMSLLAWSVSHSEQIDVLTHLQYTSRRSIFFLMLSVIMIICINPFVGDMSASASATLGRRGVGASEGHPYILWVSSLVFLLCVAVIHGIQVFRATRLLFC